MSFRIEWGRLSVVVATMTMTLLWHFEAKGDNSRENQYINPHELCECEIARAEQKYGIPHRLLMAIGIVESGHSLTRGHKRPYPWAICVSGKSYFFSTKSAAIAAVKRFWASGIRNIDVGCMQVNLLHHRDAFKTLEEAFTPCYNIDYAARFFLDLKNTYNSWTHAVGYYHSKSSKFYKPYCSAVYCAWANAKNLKINSSPRILQASSETRSQISFLPSYYSPMDSKMSARLHQLGRRTLRRDTPKFITTAET
ncbi:MAG: transglycosylase SLT domain-containing protein [Holosporaceae bacterium]|nr:transglycosylase SLT domain-containing protein [Holosporaceae bacterium]